MKRSIRPILALLVLVSLTSVGALSAQARVVINVSLGTGGTVTPANPDGSRIVVPASTAISRASQQAAWHLTGPPLAQGRTLVITAKASNTVSCFSAASFTISPGAPDPGSGAPSCPAGTTWSYDVTLYEGSTVIVVEDPELDIRP